MDRCIIRAMDTNALKKAMKDTIPVMSGYIVLGIGFGIVAYEKGFGIFWCMLMSLIVYSGALEYALIDLLAASTPVFSVFLASLAISIRHLFYGLSMIDKDRGKRKKGFLIFGLTDETYSLVCHSEEGEDYYFFVTLLDYLYWNLGTLLGSLFGKILPVSFEGIDFVLTALFVTIFVEQWMGTEQHDSSIIGLGISVVCLLVFGPDSFLFPTMLLILVALYLNRGRIEKGE